MNYYIPDILQNNLNYIGLTALTKYSEMTNLSKWLKDI